MQMLDARDPIRFSAIPPAGFEDHGLEAELQPVVRVAVQGPFNSLVLVRGTLPAGAVEAGAAGAVEAGAAGAARATFAVRTNFILAGFDPKAPPPYKHSSTAALGHGAEIDAIDHGYFDDSGCWVLLVRGDSLRGHGAVDLTSWVMCRETGQAAAAGEADRRLAFRSYARFVPPAPPKPVDAWAQAVTRLFAHRPAAALAGPHLA